MEKKRRMKTQKINNLLALLLFFASFGVYFDTMAPTVSYWDCGEFIATSYILGVPHPPGSPLYLIIGRIFSMLPISNDVAFRVNIISPIVSALAVMLLYLIIVMFVKQLRGGIKSLDDRIVIFGSGVVGSLIFAFTDSHWFNAVEAEVYSISTFLTALVVWLILRWAERSEKSGNERYFLIIAYVLGLSSGIHLLNLLALPFMGLIIYFKKWKFSWASFLGLMGVVAVTFLIIYKGIIKGLPQMALKIGIVGIAGLVILIFGITIYVIVHRRQLLSVIFSSLVLIIIGYSTYSILFIRSNQNPSIDENDPETIERAISYLEREQYGNVGVFPRRYGKIPPIHEVVGAPISRTQEYSSRQNFRYMKYEFGKQMEFLWDYQIMKMYIRYFLWQFAGRGPANETGVSNFGANPNRSEDGVNWFQFGLPFPLFLGLFGMYFQFRKDYHQAFSVMTLFFITGLAIIFYLNQDNPQPRERDYSYVGSFLAFSIWIGIGVAALLDKLFQLLSSRNYRFKTSYLAIVGLLVLIPGIMVSSNYYQHDRSGNYVAWDYSYNILQTCEPNGIIFTNGDNDTFPLWYLQEVEGIRKDVTVANLSLLNTEWYIRQLRDSRPKGSRYINLTDEQIRGEVPIGRNPTIGESLYLRPSRWRKYTFSIPVVGDEKNKEGKISWNVKPTFGNNAIRVQDLMIMHIINENKWRIPIYFAVTVSNKNKIGLGKYLQMEGLAFRLISHKAPLIEYDKLSENMSTIVTDTTWSTGYQPGYMYRNLNNPDVYLNPNVKKLLQNYRSALLQLADRDVREFEKITKLPSPNDDEIERQRQKALKHLELATTVISEETIPFTNVGLQFHIGRLYKNLGEFDRAIPIFESLYQLNPSEGIIIRELADSYSSLEEWDKAIWVVSSWLDYNRQRRSPADSIQFKSLLELYKQKRSQSAES
ncbi:MAG: DUF2723 domain-containing protein [Candidatus Marinimicrobia bacterium]|nr:DUF2723 domain-containing protein [Candidatus Neomarinimicrobiota bacterium]